MILRRMNKKRYGVSLLIAMVSSILLGAAFSAREDPDILPYQEILSKDRQNKEVLLSLAQLYLQKANAEENRFKKMIYIKRVKQYSRDLVNADPSDFQTHLSQARVLSQLPGEEKAVSKALRQAVILAPEFADKYRIALEQHRLSRQTANTEEVNRSIAELKKVTAAWLEQLIGMAEKNDIPSQNLDSIVALYGQTRELLESHRQRMDTRTELKLKILLSREPYAAYYQNYKKQHEMSPARHPRLLPAVK